MITDLASARRNEQIIPPATTTPTPGLQRRGPIVPADAHRDTVGRNSSALCRQPRKSFLCNDDNATTLQVLKGWLYPANTTTTSLSCGSRPALRLCASSRCPRCRGRLATRRAHPAINQRAWAHRRHHARASADHVREYERWCRPLLPPLLYPYIMDSLTLHCLPRTLSAPYPRVPYIPLDSVGGLCSSSRWYASMFSKRRTKR